MFEPQWGYHAHIFLPCPPLPLEDIQGQGCKMDRCGCRPIGPDADLQDDDYQIRRWRETAQLLEGCYPLHLEGGER